MQRLQHLFCLFETRLETTSPKPMTAFSWHFQEPFIHGDECIVLEDSSFSVSCEISTYTGFLNYHYFKIKVKSVQMPQGSWACENLETSPLTTNELPPPPTAQLNLMASFTLEAPAHVLCWKSHLLSEGILWSFPLLLKAHRVVRKRQELRLNPKMTFFPSDCTNYFGKRWLSETAEPTDCKIRICAIRVRFLFSNASECLAHNKCSKHIYWEKKWLWIWRL